MILSRSSVELLAPAGNWEALEAAVKAGADAVYLGGKHFNMRLHRQDMNFDDEALARAVSFAHTHGVKLYVTINNLIYENELGDLEKFLRYLGTIGPDAILVQDLAVIRLVRDLDLKIPLHASVMMNIHNEPAMNLLKEYGITRVVASRELSLDELSLLRERTGLEIEYFMHGDMCFAESGQCIHSGVLFGKSSNRGLCLKPCRWPYRLIDEETGEILDENGRGAYKLAIKDMCMYRHIPELIQAGVFSFKIEGRMRPSDFVFRIVSLYRKAIDAYLADPTGYRINEDDWRTLYDGRVRDFSTCSALGKVTAEDIGWDGSREPRFFSHAIEEAAIPDSNHEDVVEPRTEGAPRLVVHVADKESADAAIESGADAVCIGGDVYRPRRPWTLDAIENVVDYAHTQGKLVVVETPRTAMRRECGELEQFLKALEIIRPDAVCVGNLGTLEMAHTMTTLPIQADYSMNICNHGALAFLKAHGVKMATASFELPLAELRAMLQNAALPVEVVIHGAYASMLCDHNIPAFSLSPDPFADMAFSDRRYALLDEAGERHSIRIDQYGRNHILFAKDLCLYPYLGALDGAASYRIEGQDYTPQWVGRLAAFYRKALDAARGASKMPTIGEIAAGSPRKLGIGAFRF
jgi:putative protease